jgi:hypothetical protein
VSASAAASIAKPANEPASASAATGGASQKVVNVSAGDGVLYVVPQRIRPSNIDGPINIDNPRIDKKCDVFFRIRSVFENAAIEVDGKGGKLVFERGRMSPGEMVRIPLAKKYLELNDSITIKVRENT